MKPKTSGQGTGPAKRSRRVAGTPKAAHSQRELERRVFHLKTIYDVSQGLPILRGTEAILKNLLLMVMGTFGATAGLAFLMDPKAGRLEALSGRGLTEHALNSLTRELTAAGSDLGAVFGDDVATIDSASFLAAGRTARLAVDLGLQLWAPFRVDNATHGGIALGSKLLGEPYSGDDLELLGTLAAQGAVAVENTRLLERMKREEIARVNLTRYLSPHVVDQVLNNNLQVNLGGERKAVTVLFSDIRNFTTLAEACPPEQLVHFLNRYFTSMASCVFAAQGSIDKYIGDAIMAVFGSLVPLENTARSAVESAVRMMRLLAEHNEELRESGTWFPVQIGIGITSGEVFIGNIGSPERMEYTAIGDTVNVASRFSGLAAPGQILVDRDTLRSLRGSFPHRELPLTSVRGKSGKVEVFEILYG
jgi:class 3 adenylate cyclase